MLVMTSTILFCNRDCAKLLVSCHSVAAGNNLSKNFMLIGVYSTKETQVLIQFIFTLTLLLYEDLA